MSKEGNKIDDPFFINKIDKYDLAFLTETHIGYDTNIPIIGNFISFHHNKSGSNNFVSNYHNTNTLLVLQEYQIYFLYFY